MKASEYLRGMLRAIPTVEYDHELEKAILSHLEEVERAEVEIGPDGRYWLLDKGHAAQRFLRSALKLKEAGK